MSDRSDASTPDATHLAAAVAAAAVGASTERTIGAMLQRLDDGSKTMGRIEGTIDRLDGKIERALERLENVTREIGSQGARIATLEKAADKRNQTWRSAWTPLVALLALAVSIVQWLQRRA